jgi:hypothetical protein
MTSSPPPLPESFTAESDLRGGWRISRAGRYVGIVFPVIVGQPDSRWYARLPQAHARLFDDQGSAVQHITQRLLEENR